MRKLQLWQSQLATGITFHFEHLWTVVDDCQDEQDVASMFNEYVSLLKDLEQEFKYLFQDLERMDGLFDIFAVPFDADVAKAPPELQHELLELQSDRQLKEKYRLSGDLLSFYKLLPKARRSSPCSACLWLALHIRLEVHTCASSFSVK